MIVILNYQFKTGKDLGSRGEKTMITIKQAETVFYVGDSAKQPLAEMTFVYAGDNIIIIDHTSVADELRGQNIGKQLLEKLIGFAREKNKKVIPLCPFAKNEMMRNKEEYADILFDHCS